jgi:cell filamentation protein, protein adenylyltransferase
MTKGQIPTLDELFSEEDQQLSLDINGLDFFSDSQREYVKSHPWLTFKVDLGKAPPQLWLLLGEAKSKCEALGRVPLPPAMAERLHRLFLIKGVHGTTAIEGNTLTEDQVRQIVESKLNLPPSQHYLKQEVDNILVACKVLVERAVLSRPPCLSPRLIRSFNKTILNELELGEGVVPGDIRSYSVGVLRYLAAPHQDCAFLLAKLCAWLNELQDKSKSMEEEIIRAVLAHLYLAWIHPFGDGNGRTARLMEFQILINAGIPTPAAHLMSNHYNLTRSRYLQELDAASKTGGDIVPFLIYAIEGFVEQLSEQIALVAGQQLGLAWRDYVHELFAERTTQTDLRRRDLLLELSSRFRSVTKQEIRTISGRMEEAYREKTSKTITRDLNWLVDEGLLEKGPEGYSARTDIILGFLPARSKRQLEQDRVRRKKLREGLGKKMETLRGSP